MVYSASFKPIKTQNLLLDNFNFRDGKKWFKIANSYEVGRYLTGTYITDSQEAYERITFYKEMNGRNGDFYIAIRNLNEGRNLIGAIIATRSRNNNRILEIAYVIEEEYRRKGYMTEAMKAFVQIAKNKGYKNLELEIQKDNIPSKKVAEHLNAKDLGTPAEIQKEMTNHIFLIEI